MALLSWLLALFCIYTYHQYPSKTILVNDTMNTSQILKDGQTLVSPNQLFELGFFNPSHRNNIRFLGIWYKGISPLTAIWVANTEITLMKSKARLQLESNGALVLYDYRNSPIYIYTPTWNVSKPFLQIQDSGNLILRHESRQPDHLWQSFDYPSDTLLPTMTIGWDDQSPKTSVLTSWKSANDPTPGDFTLRLDKPHLPQLLLQKNSNKMSRWVYERVWFNGSDIFDLNPLIVPLLISDKYKPGFTFIVLSESALVRLQVTPFGKIQFLSWNNDTNKWIAVLTLNKNFCDGYNACGPFEICHNEKPNCRCLDGFNKTQDSAGECKRTASLKCDVGDNFTKFTGLKLPDNSVVWPNLTAGHCQNKCLQECNCNAFSYIDNGPKCVVWLGDLVDMGDIPNIKDELYIRMGAKVPPPIAAEVPPPPSPRHHQKDKKKNLNFVVIVLIICVLVLLVLLYTCWSGKKNARRLDRELFQRRNWGSNSKFRLFEMDTISVATNDFSHANKIGEGGFGPVYKGVLQNGQEIAVKRLSSSSRQGHEQFENESRLVARLQHRNLVKLIGCCVHEEERMLVYEYLANKSLDKFIFDQARNVLLTWDTRLDIILGVAKAISYLHNDSGLTIVHRDLKASNILLDRDMTPKISDFGLAKILGDDNESNERATSVCGTYGYMSPEYARNGQFSTKSDVFSFGVLVLEIISGKKNWSFEHPDHDMNLLGHAWNLWREGRALEMMDPAPGDFSFETELVRCIQVGLLCAQHDPEQRPTMSTVVLMLRSYTVALPEPTAPGFYLENSLQGGTSGFIRPLSASFNDLTVSTLGAR